MSTDIYCFRQRFRFPFGTKLNYQESELALTDKSDPHHARLVSLEKDRSLSDADEVALEGSGFPSADEARASGKMWRGALERSFAAISLGADFGDRAPRGFSLLLA